MQSYAQNTIESQIKYGIFTDWQKNHYHDFHTKYKANAITNEDKKYNQNIVNELSENYLKKPLPNFPTALHILADNGDIDCLKILLSKEVKIDATNMIRQTPLHCAAIMGKVEAVKLILDYINKQQLEDPSVLINTKDRFGFTALHEAVENGFVEIAKLLLENHADVNLENNKGVTPLHVAYQLSKDIKDAMVDLLLKHGANPEAKDHLGQTPGQPEIVPISLSYR